MQKTSKLTPKPTNKYIKTLRPSDFPKINTDVYKDQKLVDQLTSETEYIVLSKIPKMPFTRIGDYVNEYHKIWLRQSSLTTAQRMLVKNVVHSEVRIGNLIPEFKDDNLRKV